MDKVKAPYIYDTGLKKESDGKFCTTDRKDRTECFDGSHFPCRKQDCNKQQHV
jgi:hypothetical protein